MYLTARAIMHCVRDYSMHARATLKSAVEELAKIIAESKF